MLGLRKLSLVHVLLLALLGSLLLAGSLAWSHTGSGSERPDSAQPTGFTHPGVLESRDQLAFVRGKVRAGEQPWKSAYQTMAHSRYGSPDYHATPFANVKCPFDSRPGKGCTEEREDAVAAYTQALMWAVTHDRAHARHAISIMDAWSGKITEHTDDNAPLQAAWSGASWAKAGELIRYTYRDWPHEKRFERMLRRVYQPIVTAPAPQYNGNWDLAMTDAAIGIAVFLDDRKGFDAALDRFRDRLPAYFYLASDGRRPVAPVGSDLHSRKDLVGFWFKQPRFVSGLGQETCRNFKHIGYSLAASAHIAETAWHQHVDLYSEIKDRLGAALEFHARYQMGIKAPKWLCGGKITRNMGADAEVGYNHLHGKLGMRMPWTERLVKEQRPAGTDGLFVSWETLTHAGNPK